MGSFKPLVRRSLSLACALDILFLRHEERYNLMRQGGDLDGRIKTLFDALKMPDPKNEYVGDAPVADRACTHNGNETLRVYVCLATNSGARADIPGPPLGARS